MVETTIETIPQRATTRNGLELDAVEHPGALVWNHGERAKIKRGIRRRYRRQTRQALRAAVGY